MIESNKVTQSNIDSGKVTGRDDNSINHNYFFNNTINYKEDKVLKKLLEEHEKEKEKDPEYRQYSDELNSFFKIKQIENLRDLNQKMIDGKREYLIDIAIESKEKLTKKIYKFSLYKSAQDIYTYLLSHIRCTFLHSIQCRIKSNDFKIYEIDKFVQLEIIDPLLINLQDSSLNIDSNELYGILYLLTGNCHIEWD